MCDQKISSSDISLLCNRVRHFSDNHYQTPQRCRKNKYTPLKDLMSYTFALSTPEKVCSLRSASSSRSNSVSSTSSISSSIYSRTSPIISPVPTTAKTLLDSKSKQKSTISFFHTSSSSTKHLPVTPSIVDTRKEEREAREARNRAIRLREQLLREPMLEEDSSSPAERKAKRDEVDPWKMHYEMMDGTKQMMEQAKRLRR